MPEQANDRGRRMTGTRDGIRVAIETSTGQGSVAVGRGDRVVVEVVVGVQRRHAETMLPALEAALELADVRRGDIRAVVVGAGPGSFTGVRVAGATAKGLAAGLDVPLLAYSSLLALAAGVPVPGPVCALFDARRGEVYGGCWRVGRTVEALLTPRVGTVESIAAALPAGFPVEDSGANPARPAAFAAPLCVGDGALRYRERLEAARVHVATSPAYPRAGTLLWLAEHHPDLGMTDRAGWEPDYVRASSAERGVAG